MANRHFVGSSFGQTLRGVLSRATRPTVREGVWSRVCATCGWPRGRKGLATLEEPLERSDRIGEVHRAVVFRVGRVLAGRRRAALEEPGEDRDRIGDRDPGVAVRVAAEEAGRKRRADSAAGQYGDALREEHDEVERSVLVHVGEA